MSPRCLDLFAGAGGAAMGYHRAGYDVVGVDLHPKPQYPFAFVQADALAPPFDLRAFDPIHASPPCQHYSQATAWRGSREDHPDLIDAVRDMLEASGVPYVIENVEGARYRLRDPIMLCGSMFGIGVRRHRYFEVPTLPFSMVPPCEHDRDLIPFDHGGTRTESEYRDAMGCDWMTAVVARQAIPPAYTEWIGRALLESTEATP